MRLERMSQMKNPITSSGIEPSTFRLVQITWLRVIQRNSAPFQSYRTYGVKDHIRNLNLSIAMISATKYLKHHLESEDATCLENNQ
jgi:hypothetical protein